MKVIYTLFAKQVSSAIYSKLNIIRERVNARQFRSDKYILAEKEELGYPG